MAKEEYYPLFETRRRKGRLMYRVFSFSLLIGIWSIWVYRLSYIPKEDGKWVWIGLLCAELWFGFYWFLRQALRWNPIFRQPFPERLTQSRYENMLPKVDIFVCTANPDIEPPIMVINTVLSVMAYDYPTEKLSVYLSDDGGSDVTFYALLEASKFAKHWLPFCKRFKVEPRSPDAYFKTLDTCPNNAKEFLAIKRMYQDMESRVENASKLGKVPEETYSKHKEFSEWGSYSSKRDHDTILHILLHRKDNARDEDGFVMPTLVYLAREKRPQFQHNFKAGAMNSLIRVSSMISNGKIILNVDCDMYSNNSQSIRDALCFFMDEEKGHEIAFVQAPQGFENITKNDIYGGSFRIPHEVDLHGFDGFGGPMYIGTGCFHRRDALCGRKYSDQYKIDWKNANDENIDHMIKEVSLQELEEKSKTLASCTYEENTSWGKEMGLLYGCVVEDVITGLYILCKGWKSVYYNPTRRPFLGLTPTTLPESLVQHKRWSEGQFQIVLSKFSPIWYASGLINPGLQMSYCYYNLWALNSIPTLYYSIIPSLYLLKGIPLFPQISSPWFIPFAYVIVGDSTYCLLEFLRVGGTIKGWWNELRMWVYKRTSSYLFAFVDNMLKVFGFSNSNFIISTKVAEENVSQRYEKEIIEFGNSSPMLTLLATLAMLNLFCLVGMLLKEVVSSIRIFEAMLLQVLLSGVLVLINIPIYQGLFLRKDKGRLPRSVAVKSTTLALSACVLFNYLS
ncbi:cellulose synthase-like protein [Medicago truncatula]|uniref:Cellulose synthase-like protein n=1 Tax=Medicago truncatula TaxID=3880 RepID=G7IV12_MEDTR|nr:cellulose synthase-like protein [Medicago truncatula]